MVVVVVVVIGKLFSILIDLLSSSCRLSERWSARLSGLDSATEATDNLKFEQDCVAVRNP